MISRCHLRWVALKVLDVYITPMLILRCELCANIGMDILLKKGADAEAFPAYESR